MSKKSTQEAKAKRILRERELKRQQNEARVAKKAAKKGLGPAVPLFTRAGQWLSMLQRVPPALANDEILVTVAKVSLLLRGMYDAKKRAGEGVPADVQMKRLAELQVAIMVLDALGTGLSGAPVPEAWDLVTQQTVEKDAQDGADHDRADATERGDASEAALRDPQTVVECVDPTLVAGHGGDRAGEDVQPVLDAPEPVKH